MPTSAPLGFLRTTGKVSTNVNSLSVNPPPTLVISNRPLLSHLHPRGDDGGRVHESPPRYLPRSPTARSSGRTPRPVIRSTRSVLLVPGPWKEWIDMIADVNSLLQAILPWAGQQGRRQQRGRLDVVDRGDHAPVQGPELGAPGQTAPVA